MSTHKHTILLRTMVSGRIPVLTSIAVSHLDTDEVQEALVQEADRQAKGLLHADPILKALQADAVFYQVDGKTEYFISKYFYLWPNTTDRAERRPTPGKSPRRSRQRDM